MNHSDYLKNIDFFVSEFFASGIVQKIISRIIIVLRKYY